MARTGNLRSLTIQGPLEDLVRGPRGILRLNESFKKAQDGHNPSSICWDMIQNNNVINDMKSKSLNLYLHHPHVLASSSTTTWRCKHKWIFLMWWWSPALKTSHILHTQTIHAHSRREDAGKVTSRSDHISLTQFQYWFTHHIFYGNSTAAFWDMATLTCLFWEPWILNFRF